MTREEGLRQIDEAVWVRDDFGCLNLVVRDEDDHVVHAFLSMRPPYCDRGHIQLNIDGSLNLDAADRFPRYFFSFEEADAHTRTFLKWRLWKERVWPHAVIADAFEEFNHV